MALTTQGLTNASTGSGGANQQTLSEWAGPYVTDMLGKAQAISETPYQVYQGPMTAGESELQSKMFQGLGNLAFPSNLGTSFSSSGAYQLPNMSATTTPGSTPAPSAGPTGIAANYMNPYLQSVLDPQLAELRRQNDITNMKTNAQLTGAGAFGGSRQAIMNAENNRNLMQEMNKTVGQGYANAYDKAMQQFNTEQGQAKTLADMFGQAGTAQRGIEQEGITADYNEFLAQRDYPQKQVQFLQSMLQGLPISTVSNIPQSQTAAQQLFGTAGDVTALLTKLGVIPPTAAPTATPAPTPAP
jgi:hypothetical protein